LVDPQGKELLAEVQYEDHKDRKSTSLKVVAHAPGVVILKLTSRGGLGQSLVLRYGAETEPSSETVSSLVRVQGGTLVPLGSSERMENFSFIDPDHVVCSDGQSVQFWLIGGTLKLEHQHNVKGHVRSITVFKSEEAQFVVTLVDEDDEPKHGIVRFSLSGDEPRSLAAAGGSGLTVHPTGRIVAYQTWGGNSHELIVYNLVGDTVLFQGSFLARTKPLGATATEVLAFGFSEDSLLFVDDQGYLWEVPCREKEQNNWEIGTLEKAKRIPLVPDTSCTMAEIFDGRYITLRTPINRYLHVFERVSQQRISQHEPRSLSPSDAPAWQHSS
jgi:hypothetical protein